jgi:hypothetical protein
MFENTRVLILIKKKPQLDTINEKLCEAKKKSSKLLPEVCQQLKEQLAIELNNLITIPVNQNFFFHLLMNPDYIQFLENFCLHIRNVDKTFSAESSTVIDILCSSCSK